MTDLTQTQIELENHLFTTALGKVRKSIQDAQKRGEEMSLTYGQKVFDIVYPVVYNHIKEQVLRHDSYRVWTISKLLKPAYTEYLEETANPSDTDKNNPLYINALSISYALVNSLSKEPYLREVLNKSVKVTCRQFNNTFTVAQEERASMMSFYGRVIDDVVNSTNIFTLQQEEGRDIYLAITIDWVEIIERGCETAETNATEFGPMVCKPIPHKDLVSHEGGYLTTGSPLIKRPTKELEEVDGKVQRGLRRTHKAVESFTAETHPEYFEYVNKAQETPFSVNTKLLNMISLLRDEGYEFDEYRILKDGYSEVIKKETAGNIATRNKYREKFANYIAKIIKGEIKVSTMKSYMTEENAKYEPITEGSEKLEKRKVVAKYDSQIKKSMHLFSQAEQFSQYENIYYPVFVDFRGRVYPYVQYGLSPQGCEMSKALLQLGNKHKLTAEGIRQLYATLANTLGYDKMNFDLKVEKAREWYASWNGDYTIFPRNIARIDNEGNEVQFDEPINAMAIVMELVEYAKNPDYLCGYIAHRDARCSGSSLIGTSLRDRKAMRLTSVIEHGVDTTRLPDAYGITAQEALMLTKAKADKGDDVAMQLYLMRDELFTRNNFKHPVMVNISYGGTEFGLSERHKQLFADHPVLSELNAEARKLFTKITMKALDKALPACMKFLKAIKEVSKELSTRDGEIAYNNPVTGFPVVQHSFEVKKKQIKIQGNYRTVDLVLKHYTKKIDGRAICSAASPNLN